MLVMIYTKDGCPSCVEAKQYLDHYGVEYTTHVVNDRGARQQIFRELTERFARELRGVVVQTVPQIMVDGELMIGPHGELGWDALKISGLGESYRSLVA